MKKQFYIYGEQKSIKYYDDLNDVSNKFSQVKPSPTGYRAIGICLENSGCCDIIVEMNGKIKISDDYKYLGLTIDKDFWADIYYTLTV